MFFFTQVKRSSSICSHNTLNLLHSGILLSLVSLICSKPDPNSLPVTSPKKPTPHWSLSFTRSRPTPAGHKAAAEGEAHFRALVFAPSAERHHDDCAVVLGTVLHDLSKGKRERDRKREC